MKSAQATITVLMLLLTPSAALPQGAGIEWDILNQEVRSLYQNGQYDRAVVVAEKALTIQVKALGPDHPDVATSLNNLAMLYKNQGEYALAEPLYKRSLAIKEKVHGPEHPDVATTLKNLARLYKTQGKYAEA
ncbi:hypothetical protein LCGC14_2766480, partial [marine sediment metagenome]